MPEMLGERDADTATAQGRSLQGASKGPVFELPG